MYLNMNEFFSRLNEYRSRLNLRVVARAIILALACFAGILHLYYLVWLNTSPQSPSLTWLNYLLRVGILGLFAYLIFRVWRGLFNIPKTAKWLDRQVDHEDDLYQNLYELDRQKASEPVLEVLARQAGKRLNEDRYALPKLFGANQWLVLIFLLAGIGSFWALSWDNFRFALNQFYTNKAESIEYKKTIEISPGNATVGRGEQLVIEVEDPDPRLRHRLFYRWDKQWRELGMADNSYTFNVVDNSFEYYVQNEVAKSPTYNITCLDEPFAKSWSVTYNYPDYTGLGTSVDTLSYGNIEAYRQSEVILSIGTNIPAKQAVMRFSDGTSRDFQKVEETSFSTRLILTGPKTWYLELTDALGRKSRPEEKTISIIPDQAPEVRILFPGEDVVLDQDLLLPLIISANDDFGLRDLILHYQVNDRPASSLSLQTLIPSKLFTLDHTFDLRNLELLPGDYVTYWAEVFDNSPQKQSATSAKYKARFPSIEEIYQEIERQEKLKTQELSSALDKSRELQKDFEQKRRELLKDDNIEWEDQKQLEKILEEQQNLTQQVENVAEDFQGLIEKLQKNEAISAEMFQKMQKIQELMEEISNEELREAMSKFEQALQKLDPEELRKAMENYKFSMEDFSERIDQTLELLESIKKEQALEKALQISQEMEKMQSALKDKTGDPSQESSRLAEEQKRIEDKLDALQEQLENADELLDSNKDQKIKQEMDQLRQDMQKSGLKQNMQKSRQSLQQNKRSASQQSQSEALEKMRTFTKRLGEMRDSMGGGSQQEVMNAMQQAVRELLIFSKQHEGLRDRVGDNPYSIVSDLIAHYEGLQVSLNRLFSSPQVTLFLPPKFFIDLTDTNRAYRDIFINVNEMQYRLMPRQLDEIQRGLNLMIYDLMQTLNSASTGGGGGGNMQSLMQMLDQMGQEQMAMNMLTEQIFMQLQQQGGRMSPAMQQQLQKLAGDQERLAENLKRALQNNPEAQKQGNAIKQIIDEAEAISRQLRSNQLSRDLLDRQENILSRLLDAQRSINKREFSERRKAETADPSIRQIQTDEDYQALRRKAMLDDAYRLFPPSYQQVILKYLKLLNE